VILVENSTGKLVVKSVLEENKSFTIKPGRAVGVFGESATHG
jgi:hypothetical protein